MPKLIINDEEYECRLNERLLSVARRQGSHIGFVCMGRGYCHTCACQVLSGAEHLSPPTEKELMWRKTSQLRSTYRLACQAFMQGEGPVEILTRAEELRRQATNVFAPPEGTTTLENFSHLLGEIGSIVSHLPADAAGVASDIGKKRLLPRVESDIAPRILDNADPNVRETWEKIDRTAKRYTPNMKILRKVLTDTNRMAQRMIGNPNGSPIAGMPEQPAEPAGKRQAAPDEHYDEPPMPPPSSAETPTNTGGQSGDSSKPMPSGGTTEETIKTGTGEQTTPKPDNTPVKPSSADKPSAPSATVATEEPEPTQADSRSNVATEEPEPTQADSRSKTGRSKPRKVKITTSK